MELNYEKRYAYSEVDCILEWLGEEYIKKIPKKILQTIKAEKKFAYRPVIDFNKPITSQIRQEAKNMIAYLNCNYWLEDKEKKKEIEEAIKENARKKKEKNREQRVKEIQLKANSIGNTTVTASVDKALQENLKNK